MMAHPKAVSGDVDTGSRTPTLQNEESGPPCSIQSERSGRAKRAPAAALATPKYGNYLTSED
jgi:hypothetical protein